MNTLKQFCVALLVSGMPTVLLAQSPVASLELYPISGGATEVRIGARMTPQTTVLSLEAVSVAVAYDYTLFSVDAATSIQNRHFEQYGWEDGSAPDFQTNKAPGICVYGEYHPNFGSQTIFRGLPPTLCEFVFYPRSGNPGTADFTVYANNPSSALTYYFEYQVSTQMNYDPVTNITGMFYPVELSALTAAQQGQAVALRWVTQTESGNYGFHVQRRDATAAAADWTTLGFVEGAGDTKLERQYLYFDRNLPGAGVYAYRLVQEDFDGVRHILDEVFVDYSASPLQYALRHSYPNPVSLGGGESAQVVYDLAERSRVRLTVSNLLGQPIAVIANHELDAGSYSAAWRPVDLPAGTYIVTFAAESLQSGTTALQHMRLQLVR